MKMRSHRSLPQWGKVARERVTDEVSEMQNNSSSTAKAVPLLPQEKANPPNFRSRNAICN